MQFELKKILLLLFCRVGKGKDAYIIEYDYYGHFDFFSRFSAENICV